MKYPRISIVFPTFNGWPDTKECLESIAKLNYPKTKIEVIVVDNGSTDESVKFIKELTSSRVKELDNSLINNSLIKNKSIKLIENKKNLGFSKAVNQGIKKSKGNYLLITNNDIVFDSYYLKTLVRFLQKNPKVGIVGGKVYCKHPKKKVAFAGARFNFYTGLSKLGPTPHQTSETDWTPGCNLLIKREVLDKIGIFDEEFFFYFEDLDLCLRAKKAGYKVIYHPKAVLWHDGGASIDREGKQRKTEFYYQGKMRILFKHATKTQLISCLLSQFLVGFPFHLIVLKNQNYPLAIKALVKCIKNSAKKSP